MIVEFIEKKEMGFWTVSECKVDGVIRQDIKNLEGVHKLLNQGKILNCRGTMEENFRSTVVEVGD